MKPDLFKKLHDSKDINNIIFNWEYKQEFYINIMYRHQFFSSTISSELVKIQPMGFPSRTLFYLDYV